LNEAKRLNVFERLEQLGPFELVAVQRLLKAQNPHIGEINLGDLVDNRLMRKLDESGFIERLYTARRRGAKGE
jgi:hypothetical protein